MVTRDVMGTRDFPPYVTTDRALSSAVNGSVLSELRDRVEVVDALYRFGLGQDLRQPSLLGSAFAADAELDFRPVGEKLGFASVLMRGRSEIVKTILTVLANIDTSHVVSNPRVRFDGDLAHLTALVEAQHVTKDQSDELLLKNLYSCELVPANGRWVLSRVHIRNLWHFGNVDAIFG